jgi:hypothetical protein
LQQELRARDAVVQLGEPAAASQIVGHRRLLLKNRFDSGGAGTVMLDKLPHEAVFD